MRIWCKIMHSIHKKDCLKDIEWDCGNRVCLMRCKRCGKFVAYFYKINDEVRVCCFEPYKQYAMDIKEIIDAYLTSHPLHMGYNDNEGWEPIQNLIEDIRTERKLLSMETRWGELDKNWNSEESAGFGGEYILGIDLSGGTDTSF